MKKLFYFIVIILIGMLYTTVALANPVAGKIMIDAQDGFIDTGATALVEQDRILVPVAVIKEYLHDSLTVDPVNDRLKLSVVLPRFRLETEHLDRFIYSGVDVSFAVKKISGQPYVDLAGLDKLLGLAASYQQANNTLLIQTGKSSFFSPIQLNQPRAQQVFSGKINLVWDHVMKDSRNLNQEAKIPGLDILAPTWFAVISEEGDVASKADLKYVQDAHEKGYKVWALVSNSFDRDLTRAVLNNERARRNVIKQLLVYSSLYNLDGINIDFENMYDEDQEKFTAFIRELTSALKEQNVMVSVDITIPAPTPYWSLCYNRSELGQIVDYVMVMTYDEHWRSSPVSGSVASQGWVEKGIAATLKSVPKEKLLMGIPFYTREWEETSENGRVTVKSRTLSMAQAKQVIAEQNLTPVWLKDKGQNYVEYNKADKRYRIWLEDQASVRLKAGLVQHYQLAGAASWRKDFEQPEIWETLNAILKKQAAGH